MKNSIIKSLLLLFFFCLSLNIFAQLTSGLVSVWEFNEASGTSVIDALGISNGTNYDATINQTGLIGQSYKFNGTSNYVLIPHNANLNPNGLDYSINVWVKWEGTALSSSIGGVIQKGNYTSDGSEIQFTLRGGGTANYNKGFYFRLRSTVTNDIGCTLDQTSIVGNGNWHMLTAVVDEGGSPEGKIYLDGSEVGSLGSITAVINNTAVFNMGKYVTTYFNGKIDQPAVWNKALSAAEISTLYNSGIGLAYTSWGGTTLSGGTISPTTLTIASGTSPGTITSTAGASGGTGTYTYQWQNSTNGSTYTDISGATGTTYAAPTLTQNTWYKRKVTSGAATAYSNVSQITVTASLSGGTISPATLTITSGTSPGTISNATAASGGSGTLNYQWENSTNGSTYTNISSATATSYTAPALTQNTWFRRKVTDGNSAIAYSNVSQITVTASLSGGTISPATLTITSGTSPGTISNATAASGGSGTLNYQWENSTNGSTYTNISSATAASYTAPALTQNTWYRRKVTDGNSAIAYSNVSQITVTASLSGGTITPSTLTITSGTSPGTISNATAASGGSGTLNYQWENSTNGSTYTNISSATATSYTAPALTQNTWYRRKVTDGNSATAYSNVSQITVNETPSCPVTSVNTNTGSVQLNLSLNSNNLSIAGGNTVALPALWSQTASNNITPAVSGNVGIGTSIPDQKLTVDGKIHAEEVLVDLNIAGPDYVFENDYQLRTVKELEEFVNQNKHLPEIPSAKEMGENGISLSDLNMLLLKRIEELTLYIIDQEQRIKKLEKGNNN